MFCAQLIINTHYYYDKENLLYFSKIVKLCKHEKLYSFFKKQNLKKRSEVGFQLHPVIHCLDFSRLVLLWIG